MRIYFGEMAIQTCFSKKKHSIEGAIVFLLPHVHERKPSAIRWEIAKPSRSRPTVETPFGPTVERSRCQRSGSPWRWQQERSEIKNLYIIITSTYVYVYLHMYVYIRVYIYIQPLVYSFIGSFILFLYTHIYLFKCMYTVYTWTSLFPVNWPSSSSSAVCCSHRLRLQPWPK